MKPRLIFFSGSGVFLFCFFLYFICLLYRVRFGLSEYLSFVYFYATLRFFFSFISFHLFSFYSRQVFFFLKKKKDLGNFSWMVLVFMYKEDLGIVAREWKGEVGGLVVLWNVYGMVWYGMGWVGGGDED